jgi:hypothetical protein
MTAALVDSVSQRLSLLAKSLFSDTAALVELADKLNLSTRR